MSKSLLVVDPNPNTKDRVIDALGQRPIEVHHAKDQTEALQIARNNDVQVALAAASLPTGTGYELAEQLRDIRPETTVFLLAGGFEVYDATRAAKAGVVGRIPKPFSPDTLLFHITSAVGSLDVLEAKTPEPEAESEVELEVQALDDDALEVMPDESLTPLGESETIIRVRERQQPTARSKGIPEQSYRPPNSNERIATLLPRDYNDLPRVSVDPAIVGPAIEQAIMEVLPEVVEVVLRNSLNSSGDFRELIQQAVDDAVKRQLPKVANNK